MNKSDKDIVDDLTYDANFIDNGFKNLINDTEVAINSLINLYELERKVIEYEQREQEDENAENYETD